jgi:hypothetical protein
MSYGAQIKFGIGRQSGVGSGNAVTAPGSFHHIPLVSEDVGYSKEEVISANLTGRFEQGAVYDGIANISGTIQFEPEPWSIGAILDATINHPTSVASGSMKTFTFFPRTSDYSSLFVNEPYTIYKQFSDSSSAEHYFDCQFGQVDLTFAQGQLMTARAQVVGGSRAATGIGSLSLALHTADAQRNWLWDVCSVSFNGTAIGQASEVTVSLNESIEPLYTLNGQLTPYKYGRSGFREVTVSGTMYFTERAIYNDFISGTQRRLILTAKNTRVEIQSGYNPFIEIDVPQLKVTEFKPGASGPGEVAVTFTGRGVTDSNSNYSLKITLINTLATSVY